MNRRGFTLIELLLAISIFSMLSSFVVANYRSNEKIKILKNQAQMVVDGLQKTQNMSLTGATVGDLFPLSYEFEISDCSEVCSYKIRAEMIDEEVLISQVNFYNLTIKTSEASGILAASFFAPRAKMTLNNQKNEAFIELSNKENYFYCVKINSLSGRIESKSGGCQ